MKKADEFVHYGKWLAAPRDEKIFVGPKIIIRRTDDQILAAIDESDAVCVKSCHVLKLKDETAKRADYSFILGALNSRLTQFVFELQNPQMVGKTFAEIKVVYVERLPIPAASASQQAEISGLVEQILAARAADVAADVSQLEAQIDALVYALYGLDDDEIALVEAA